MRVFILLFGSLFVGLCCGFLTFLSLVPTIIYVSPKNSSPVVISQIAVWYSLQIALLAIPVWSFVFGYWLSKKWRP